MNFPRNMSIRIWETPEAVFGQLNLPLKIGGSFTVTVKLTTQRVIQALHRAGIRFDKRDIQQIGSLFGKIGKFLKKVAKNSVIKAIVKVGTKIAKSPLVKMIVPQAAAAIEAAEGAVKLIRSARKGNPKAKLAMKAALTQAKLENRAGKQLPLPSAIARRSPKTQSAFRYLVTVQRTAA